MPVRRAAVNRAPRLSEVDEAPARAYIQRMIGFLFKKNFFDLWDNLYRIALVNLGFVISAAVPALVPTLLLDLPVLAVAVLAVGILWCCVYLAAAARCVSALSDYGSFGFRDFGAALRAAWPSGLLVGGAGLLIALFVSTALSFYLRMNSMVGIGAAALVFWTVVITVLAVQYYFAVLSRLDGKLLKALKKCFILFFDNPGLSILLFVANTVGLFLSFFLAFLAPGPAGALLFTDEALRLRLLKYDWLEANPGADRRKVPWEELIAEDREKTGTRSLRSFIFPWKD